MNVLTTGLSYDVSDTLNASLKFCKQSNYSSHLNNEKLHNVVVGSAAVCFFFAISLYAKCLDNSNKFIP